MLVMRQTFFLVMTCLVTMIVIGCGSSNSSNPETTQGGASDQGKTPSGEGRSSETRRKRGESGSKVVFIKRADAICTKSNRHKALAARAYQKAHAPLSRKGIEGMLKEVIVPEVRKQANEIANMRAPQGEEEEVAAVVAALRQAAVEVEKDPASALNLKLSPFLKSNEVASGYGFRVCAQN